MYSATWGFAFQVPKREDLPFELRATINISMSKIDIASY